MSFALEKKISTGSIATIVCVLVTGLLVVGADQQRIDTVEKNQNLIQQQLRENYVRYRDIEPLKKDISEINQQMKELNSNFNEYLLNETKKDNGQ